MSITGMPYAVCRLADGVVVNTIISFDGDASPLPDCQLIQIPKGVSCWAGCVWDGEKFTGGSSSEPIPDENGDI